MADEHIAMSDVVLDLPPPVSVNNTRKIDWFGHKKLKAWKEQADRYVMSAKRCDSVRFDRIPRFELHVILSEDHCNLDADNSLKSTIDYLRRIEVIANDAKKNMRRIVVEWGYAPAGMRVTVRPIK